VIIQYPAGDGNAAATDGVRVGLSSPLHVQLDIVRRNPGQPQRSTPEWLEYRSLSRAGPTEPERRTHGDPFRTPG
jgi:hypothetical protein